MLHARICTACKSASLLKQRLLSVYTYVILYFNEITVKLLANPLLYSQDTIQQSTAVSLLYYILAELKVV